MKKKIVVTLNSFTDAIVTVGQINKKKDEGNVIAWEPLSVSILTRETDQYGNDTGKLKVSEFDFLDMTSIMKATEELLLSLPEIRTDPEPDDDDLPF